MPRVPQAARRDGYHQPPVVPRPVETRRPVETQSGWSSPSRPSPGGRARRDPVRVVEPRDLDKLDQPNPSRPRPGWSSPSRPSPDGRARRDPVRVVEPVETPVRPCRDPVPGGRARRDRVRVVEPVETSGRSSPSMTQVSGGRARRDPVRVVEPCDLDKLDQPNPSVSRISRSAEPLGQPNPSSPMISTGWTSGWSALGGIRTPNLLIRSQMLYPLSYERWAGRV